jgi:hypothetical protein
MAKPTKKKLPTPVGNSKSAPAKRAKSTQASAPQPRAPRAGKTRRLAERIATNARADSPVLLLERSSTSGYEAANESELRGYIYWRRDADTRRELSASSDQEIRRKVHFLYANTGIGRRIVNGAAKLLGHITPQPTCFDEAWNDEAWEIFSARAGSPALFDTRGRHDYWTAQVALNRGRFKDGRVLTVLTESEGKAARTATYEAHQIQNDPKLGKAWEEGILPDRFDRHTAYSLRDGQNTSRYAVIDARDAIYYGNFDSEGRLHGLSILAHAVPNLSDVVELRGFRKHSQKIAAQMGIVVEQNGGRMIQVPGVGLVGPMVQRPLETQTTTVGEDGTETTSTIKRTQDVEEAFLSGGLARLDPGQTVRLLTDDRPGQNAQEFERALIEDCILGTNLPPSALYYIAGMTGPSVRLNMTDIQRWILLEHSWQKQWCRRIYAYVIAKEIAAGRLRMPIHPKTGEPEPYWRRVEWIPLADPTIDVGREGNLAIQRLQAGLTTWADEYRTGGAFSKKKLRDQIRAFAEMKDYAGSFKLSMGEVFPMFGKISAVFQDNVTSAAVYEASEEPLKRAA